ncbi:hypothetical protein NFI96_034299 [Prochilodus magdalenae]|nr:hypothetical protein NFI96_034299 [Prochilodus magdalenae]
MCSNTPEMATGSDKTVKFYYNDQKQHCVPFFNNGDCGGGNCFDSDKDCMKTCSMEFQSMYPEEDAVCSLKMEPGNCFASILMYHYDSNEKTCRLFFYTGCHGNGNRFESREDCQKTCQAKSGRLLGGADDPSPDQQTVDVGLIVGILGGVVFAVAVISAAVLLVKQR